MRPRALAIACLLTLALAATAFAVEPFFTDDLGLAVRGFDPVAYFTDGKPVAGLVEFSFPYQGAIWRFASAEHRDLFKADPAKYAPQYGGYCAYAVSLGKTAPIDPQAWKVVAGKLYLNKNPGIQKDWEEDIPGNIQKGDANWPRILAEK